MIPNPHLETPNYSINRLRMDDLTADVAGSYMLVEKPAEEKAADLRTRTAKSHRAKAVVQGITPHNRHR